MVFRELLNIFRQELSHLYPRKEIDAVFFRLSSHFYQIKRIDLSLMPELKPDDNKLHDALDRLITGEPWQYIIEKTEFYGLDFKVNNNVLIPRPETEELVDWVLKTHRKNQLKVLDIGTGSGVIAISLAKYLHQAEVTAIDISETALEVARENAESNQVEIDFRAIDILKASNISRKKFDLIVSNPPYVRNSERKLMQKNVLNFEPEKALFVNDDNALIFYKKIIEFALNNATQNSYIYFEINEFLKHDLSNLLRDKNLNQYEFRKDIFGKYRMLEIELNTG